MCKLLICCFFVVPYKSYQLERLQKVQTEYFFFTCNMCTYPEMLVHPLLIISEDSLLTSSCLRHPRLSTPSVVTSPLTRRTQRDISSTSLVKLCFKSTFVVRTKSTNLKCLPLRPSASLIVKYDKKTH